MELEDLVLKRFRVERIGPRMMAFPHPHGNYKADSAEKIERALNTLCSVRETDNIFVKSFTGKKWHHIIRHLVYW
jgi:hypothetical protein